MPAFTMAKILRGNSRFFNAHSATNILFKRTLEHSAKVAASQVKVISQSTHSPSSSKDQTHETETENGKTSLGEAPLMSFKDLQRLRTQQARRSVFFRRTKRTWPEEVVECCSEHGPIKTAFHKQDKTAQESQWSLVEFESEESVEKMNFLCSKTKHKFGPGTKFFYLDRGRDKKQTSEKKQNKKRKAAKHGSTLTQKIQALYEDQKISEAGYRLRYLICSQLENELCSYNPPGDYSVQPFGSSTTGFGKENSDLDMVVNLPFLGQEDADLTKNVGGLEIAQRIPSDREFLAYVASLCRNMLPNYDNVFPILMARVPIIKLDHTPSQLQCDIAALTHLGFQMSEELYELGLLDPRVCPLVVAVKDWAAANNITQSGAPGPAFTSFTLTMLVVFFLQSRQILPPMSQMQSRRDLLEIKRLSGEDNVGELPQLVPSNSTESLGLLFTELMDFYSNFPFERLVICVSNATAIDKKGNSPLCVLNPLDQSKNVSKNVAKQMVAKFSSLCYKTKIALHEQYGREF